MKLKQVMRQAVQVGSLVALTAISGTALAQVKIGFMATLSGPAAALGQDQFDGFMLGVEHVGGRLGGAAIEVIREDDQLKPDLGVQTIRKFLEKDQVDIITGVTFSNVMMAIAKPLADSGITFISSNAGPAPLAGAQCSANFFWTSWQNDNQAEAMGQYANDKGYKNVYMMAPNYQSGKDQLEGFKRMFKGNVVGEVYTQLNQPDYTAEIAQMMAAKPDALYVFYPGGMGINFIKQMRQAGALGKVPFLSASTADGTTLPALKEVALGVIAGTFWGPDFNNPVSQKFVADFRKKHNRIPSQYAAQAYDSALLLDAALRKTGGKANDRKALQAAIRSADFKSLRGSFRFNRNGYPIQDFYAFEVARDTTGEVSLKTLGVSLRNHQDAYVKDCKL
ncbi:MAG: ABC transporter substrate-binding protein [Betaproteobacteria bacterium]|nr:ABC transporter substrate-binding protein [Betaproteobacteria bacterium]